MTVSNHDAMSPVERRAALSLALVYVLRMMGLFMVLPVLALHAANMPNSTPLLLGIAVGIYGLTQALLQIPLGLLSDRWGRKPVILLGLSLFAIGSILAALATSVSALIAGRALQGAGAIAAAVMALAADLSRDTQRSKMMGLIGASIGAAFILSLILGPVLATWLGVPGLFWCALLMAIASAACVIWGVPTPRFSKLEVGGERSSRIQPWRSRALWQLSLSALLLHAVLTALFVFIPFVLRDTLGLKMAAHSGIYLLVILASLLLVVPTIIKFDRGQMSLRGLLSGAIVLLICAFALMSKVATHVSIVVAALFLFFVAFNVLEAVLPAQLSKCVSQAQRGGAMGVYASCQFAGAFLGGAAGGWILQCAGQFVLSLAVCLVLLLWWLCVWRFTP